MKNKIVRLVVSTLCAACITTAPVDTYAVNLFTTINPTEEDFERVRNEKSIEANNLINNFPKDDIKVWYMNYRKVVNEYALYFDPPETLYDYYNDAETTMLFKVVQAEIGDEYTFKQKCNVASVIFNRLENDKFEDEMLKILTSDQFATIENGRYKNVKISDDTMLACEYVFIFGDTTNGCLFFDSNGMLKYKFEMNDGAHNFYKLKGE